MRRKEDGFTLIEVLVAMAIIAILMTLSAGALRTYWLTRGLDGSTNELVSQMRRAQEATVSESHPVVFGIRFRNDSSEWDVIRYDPAVESGPECTVSGDRDFSSGVFDAEVVVLGAGFDVTNATAEVTACRTDLGVPSTDQFVFFYPRGTATPGGLTLHQPGLGSDHDQTINVTGLTGRVTRS